MPNSKKHSSPKLARTSPKAMIPLYDENPTSRFPIVTVLIMVCIAAVWILLQGAGLDARTLAASVCNLGLVAGEVTGRAHIGESVPLGEGLRCVVDHDAINKFTPITSMFLHGSWMHLLGNLLFFWVFGNNIEDAMGRLRFLAFYLLCGLAAAATQVALDPSAIVPMVGASGAIAGVMGAYLLLHPNARVGMLFVFVIFFKVIRLPAWLVLLWWFGLQVLSGLPQLHGQKAMGGVAVWAHIGGFVAGMLLIPLFKNRRRAWR